jgi:hypothetical protein
MTAKIKKAPVDPGLLSLLFIPLFNSQRELRHHSGIRQTFPTGLEAAKNEIVF